MANGDRIGGTTFSTPTDRELVATRIFDAPRSVVWEALTSPRHLPRWMLGADGWTMPICEVDLRPGGAWHYGWRRADGTELERTGTFREVNAPERLIHTEASAGDGPETLHTRILTDADGRTASVTTVLYPSTEARDRAAATGTREGWARSYERLDQYLKRFV